MSTTIEGHLKVTIATMPGGNAFDMTGRDLQLSRAALLYADTIEIVSPGAQMLDSALAAGRGREGMREFMLEAGPGMLEGASEEQLRETQRVIAGVASKAFREAAAQLAPHSQEAAEVRLLEAQLDQMLDQASAMMEENLAGPRQERNLLQPAIDQGIVSIHRSGYLGLTGPDEVMGRFVEHLDALLGDTSTQLLLDDDLAALVRARGTESSSFVERNAQEAFVGSGLISRLPTLQTLPVDELLDLRTGLDQQRRKYLRAVSALSQKMTTTAFAPERSDELEHLWRTDVSPALDDLRDQLADHSLVREMARRAGTDARTFAAASGAGGFGWLSLGVLQDADLLTALVAAAPAAGVAATSLAHALQHRHAGRREATTRDLYYPSPWTSEAAEAARTRGLHRRSRRRPGAPQCVNLREVPWRVVQPTRFGGPPRKRAPFTGERTGWLSVAGATSSARTSSGSDQPHEGKHQRCPRPPPHRTPVTAGHPPAPPTGMSPPTAVAP